jgi:cell division protein FtsB
MLEKLKKNYFLLIATFLLLYFFFNLLDGERGLISYLNKKNELIQLETKESRLINKIEELEFKNLLLTDNLDLDYVETIIKNNDN